MASIELYQSKKLYLHNDISIYDHRKQIIYIYTYIYIYTPSQQHTLTRTHARAYIVFLLTCYRWLMKELDTVLLTFRGFLPITQN